MTLFVPPCTCGPMITAYCIILKITNKIYFQIIYVKVLSLWVTGNWALQKCWPFITTRWRLEMFPDGAFPKDALTGFSFTWIICGSLYPSMYVKLFCWVLFCCCLVLFNYPHPDLNLCAMHSWHWGTECVRNFSVHFKFLFLFFCEFVFCLIYYNSEYNSVMILILCFNFKQEDRFLFCPSFSGSGMRLK